MYRSKLGMFNLLYRVAYLVVETILLTFDQEFKVTLLILTRGEIL